MKRLILVFAAALAASCSQPAQPSDSAAQTAAPAADTAQPGSDPAVVITAIYQPYLASTSQPLDFEDAAPWTSELRAQIVAMEARSEAAGEPILDFDPIVNAQDWQITDLNVATEAVSRASHAVVRARFRNGGAPVEVVYDLVWAGNQWRIDNIRGPEFDLRQTIAAPG